MPKTSHPQETIPSVPPPGTSGLGSFHQFQASIGKPKPPALSSKSRSKRSNDEDEMMVDAQTARPSGKSEDPFEHGPSELPPRPYPGGADAESPWKPQKKLGKIPGSAMDYLPLLEARFDRLETAIDKFIDYRAEKAIANSQLPGETFDVPSSLPPTTPSSSYEASRHRSHPTRDVPFNEPPLIHDIKSAADNSAFGSSTAPPKPP